MTAGRRLLTIGHSYCVRRNRELAEAIAAAGVGDWDVTVLAPAEFPGDLGPIVTRRETNEQCRLVTVPVRTARRIHLMRYGRALRETLAEGWTLVHCWEEPYVLSGLQIARRCPPDAALVFATFQNLAKHYPPPFAAIERFNLRRANGWIAFGHSVEDVLLQRRGYAERPHAVIPFGVDTVRFTRNTNEGATVRGPFHWDDDTPVIGFLGRFIEAKGIPLLLEILRRLAQRGARWRALFVGGGALEGALRAFAAEHSGRVHIATGIGHDEVPRYLSAMDVLCAPSQTTTRWREQFGRMIIEALACGVAVVGSDSGEIPHVIGDAGIVAGEHDVDAWVRALEILLTDAAARTELAARGRQRAEAEFAWPAVAARHLTFFARVLEA